MDFRLLGPLEVADQERVLALGGVKQRSLLALLLLHANEVVAAERLIGELWGEAPPATASKSIQSYVMRYRRELGAERLTTRAPGYVLNVGPDELDVAVFERLRAEARRAEPARAAAKLREALALWRGSPLADLAYEPFAQTEIRGSRSCASRHSRSASTPSSRCGRHAELVAELETLIAAHPLRERLRGQLMLALYRAGRQAEALQVYRSARRELAEELGLEPGEALRRLEQADPAAGPRARARGSVAPAAGAAGDRALAADLPA